MNDGGPAFPNSNRVVYDGSRGMFRDLSSIDGMSLRDHFAGLALALLTNEAAAILEQNHHNPVLTAQDMARRAYLYADAMIEERKNKNP